MPTPKPYQYRLLPARTWDTADRLRGHRRGGATAFVQHASKGLTDSSDPNATNQNYMKGGAGRHIYGGQLPKVDLTFTPC